MKPLTTPEQAAKNVKRFEQLRTESDLTQAQAAAMIAEQTGRPCSLRTVRSWLNDPATISWRPCPDWAVLALETRIVTSRLKQR
jgi:hypothetical protein